MNHWYGTPVSLLRSSLTAWALLLIGCMLAPASLAQAQKANSKKLATDQKAPAQDKDGDTVKEEEAKQKSSSEAVGDDASDATKPKPAAKPTLAVIGATVHTLGPKGTIENAVILLTEDKIAAVGKGLKVPDGIDQIDASGLILTPGLIDASSRLWLTSSAATSTASDASLNVLDGVDPFDDQWHEVVRHGVTSVYVQPGSRGTLGGYGAVLSVVPAEQGPVVHHEHAAVQASIGIGATSNRTRVQQLDRTKKALKDAVAYQEKWDKYNAYLKKKKAAEKAGSKKKSSSPSADSKKPSDSKTDTSKSGSPKPDAEKAKTRQPQRTTGRPAPTHKSADKPKDEGKADSKDSPKEDSKKAEKPPTKPEQDDRKERLAKVASGAIPMRLEINNSDDAFYARQLLKEFPDLQIVLTGLSDLRSATDSVADLGVPVVVGPWLEAESGYRSSPDAATQWAKMLDGYEGALVIGSGGATARSSRLLRAHASRAVSCGFSTEQALAAITINAARSLGVASSVGSIAAGKRADLAGFQGHPLDTSASVSLVISGGKVVFHSEADRIPAATPDALHTIAELDSIESTKIALRTQNYLNSDGTTVPRTVIVDRDRAIVVRVDAIDAEVDSSIQVIDLGEAWVTPGLFSAHATLGLSGLVDPGLSDATYVVAADAFSSGFDDESKLVESGLLRALLAPSDANTLSGSASLVRLGAKEPIVSRIAATKFSMSDEARSISRFPSSLAGQSQLIQQSLNGQLLDTRLYIPQAAQERLAKERLDRLKSIASGETLAVIAASSNADMRAALDLIESRKLKAAIIGPQQLTPFVDRLKSLNVTVIARPIVVNDYNWYCQDLADASNAGVTICFAGEDAEDLRLTAAMAVESGMSPTAALISLCFGLDGPKSDKPTSADFVIWSHSPLSLSAKPMCVMVDGEIVSTDLDQRGTDEN
ncbi:MAG: hypothetical protein Aurels2KO_23520 [Aureliella sp.]